MLKKVDTNVKAEFNTEVSQWREYHMGCTRRSFGRRRIKLIPFDVTIPEPERDRHLLKKLKEELPGIMAWAVRGCLEWIENG